MARLDTYNREANKALENMVYKDLKIACIVRGMPFEEIVEGDHSSLSRFFVDNFYEKKDPELLEDFDLWMDKQLQKRGYSADDPIRAFKLSSIVDEAGDLKIQKAKVNKVIKVKKAPKAKKERNSTFNVIKGTKKEYTMELVQKLHQLGKNLDSPKIKEKLLQRVTEQFPEANAKSVMIWYKKAVKSLCR